MNDVGVVPQHRCTIFACPASRFGNQEYILPQLQAKFVEGYQRLV